MRETRRFVAPPAVRTPLAELTFFLTIVCCSVILPACYYEAGPGTINREFMGPRQFKLDPFIVEADVRSYSRSSNDWVPLKGGTYINLHSGPVRILYPKDWALVSQERINPAQPGNVHWNEYGLRYRATFQTPNGVRDMSLTLRDITPVNAGGRQLEVEWHLFPENDDVRWEPQAE